MASRTTLSLCVHTASDRLQPDRPPVPRRSEKDARYRSTVAAIDRRVWVVCRPAVLAHCDGAVGGRYAPSRPVLERHFPDARMSCVVNIRGRVVADADDREEPSLPHVSRPMVISRAG